MGVCDQFYTSVLSKIPFKVFLIWLIVVLVGYYFFFSSQLTNDALYNYSTSYQMTLSNQFNEYMPQAIVFIAMGNIARDSLIEDSILSVRLLGHWTSPIIILTDKPKCFESLLPLIPAMKVLEVPSKASIIEIKTMKAEIFSYMPAGVDKVLYMDVDILVTRSLGSFFHDLTDLLHTSHTKALETIKNKQSTSTIKTGNLTTTIPYVDFGAFYDARNHYVGFCSGCEKWHTGVMYLVRDQSKSCLKEWATVLTSGRFQTDQQSIDYAEATTHSCQHPLSFPTRHLLFAKDYIAMILTSGQTFIHLTSANHIGNQDYFYRYWVVPKLRNTLHPPLRKYNENEKNNVKQC